MRYMNTFTKTVNGCKIAVVDWKGIKGKTGASFLEGLILG